MIKPFIATTITLLSFFLFITEVSALEREFKTTVCTKVGNPQEVCTTIDTQSLSSCPLKGKRNITCGSFMSSSEFNQGGCPGAEPVDRGHCGRKYLASVCRYEGDIEAINDKRTAHSIDIPGNVGEIVYLPTIDGQIAEWTYGPSYEVDTNGNVVGGGYGNVFIANVGSDKWIIHLVHTTVPILPPANGSTYKSGDPVTTIAQSTLAFNHVHINIGKNPAGANGGAGWLNPDMDLGMCTKEDSEIPAPSPTSPIDPNSDFASLLKSEFAITMTGFSDAHLRWAFEEMRRVSSTKFPSLVRNTTITAKLGTENDWWSQVNGCSIKLVQNQDIRPLSGGSLEEIFKITFIHELGHVIQNCRNESQKFFMGNNPSNLTHEQAFAQERGITFYAQNGNDESVGCPGEVSLRNEDYAEMIAYYLHPDKQTKDVCVQGREPNPIYSGKYPLHKQLAEKILGPFR